MSNANHPQKDATIKVEPIRELKDIKQIKKNLAAQPRNLALFVVGINTNLRASDLLRLTVEQVKTVRPMEDFEIKEKKTKKPRRLTLNAAAVKAIRNWLKAPAAPASGPLFRGQRGTGALTTSSVTRLVKTWCADINLRGNYGSHTLRKTWGYHQRVTYGRGIAELMVAFNHTTQKQTLDYLCIQPEEIKSIFNQEL